MRSDILPRFREVSPGWQEFGEARVCIVDVEAAFASLYRAYFDEVGSSADYFLYLAGLRAASLWARRFDSRTGVDAIDAALDMLCLRGFGQFRIERAPTDRRDQFLVVVAENSMEAWGLNKAGFLIGRCACKYTSGLLAGLWSFALAPSAPGIDIAGWETECIALGARQCRFELGPETELRGRGLADPWPDRGVRWRMQDLSRKLDLSSDRLSELERSLAERQHAYQSLLDNMNDVLVVIDEHKKIVYANKVFLENTRTTLEEVVGQSPLRWVDDEDRPTVEQAYDELLSGRAVQATYKFRARRGGPSEVIIESSARRIAGPNGASLIQAIGRDITERERTRKQLEATLAELTHKQQIADNDLRTAKSVHESLLPGAVMRTEIDLDVKYRPVDRVGGDYCHVHFPEDRFCLVTVCDVSGHGVASALLASRVSSFLQNRARHPQDPFRLTEELNTFLRRYFSETGLFVTFFAIAIDLDSFDVKYCGAGHPAPLIWRKQTGVVEPLASQNFPVGILDRFSRREESDQSRLFPGDRLLLYTDGVTEVMNEASEQLGWKGLSAMFAESNHMPFFGVGDWLIRRIGEYSGGKAHDDMTLLLLEAKTPRNSQRPATISRRQMEEP